jgi:hypothetical protein
MKDAYPGVEYLITTPIWKVLVLLINVRLGYKGLPGTNMLAFSLVCFIYTGPGSG